MTAVISATRRKPPRPLVSLGLEKTHHPALDQSAYLGQGGPEAADQESRRRCRRPSRGGLGRADLSPYRDLSKRGLGAEEPFWIGLAGHTASALHGRGKRA